MGDLISRAEAIKAVKFYEAFCDPYPRVIESLERLPSVQPDKDLIHLQKEQAYLQGYEDGKKSRKGKWIDGKCDQCGEHAPYWSMATTYYCSDFCPNCGADMRGDSDD